MSGLIDLNSDAGEEILKETTLQMGSFYQPLLHGIFAKQVGSSTCGIQSASLVISAAHLGQIRPQVTSPLPPGHPEVAIAKEDLKFTEESLLNSPHTQPVVPKEVISKNGMTLRNCHDIIAAHGYKAEMHHAEDRTVNQFREDAVAALAKSDSSAGLVVNYHMGTLGQGVFLGHLSPLAAYHQSSDRFLILDTWPATQECWATADSLFNAMNTVDKDSGKTRGYCVFHL